LPIKRQKIQHKSDYAATTVTVATVIADSPCTFTPIVQAKEVKLSDSPVNVVEIKSTTRSSAPRTKSLLLAIPNVFKQFPQKHEMQSPKPVVTTRGMKRRRSVDDA